MGGGESHDEVLVLTPQSDDSDVVVLFNDMIFPPRNLFVSNIHQRRLVNGTTMLCMHIYVFDGLGSTFTKVLTLHLTTIPVVLIDDCFHNFHDLP